ncbi:hypothetical protein BpOF4_11600 [Alkalihalophilus pseudofirmus OF4]|uniref:YrzI family small protein n=1 Tax=Alkalihalophilus pseudofirmus (strain ATCC BAA-2126 / JCM 17055 / OF4) TaxID=398511 RepID=D3FVU1_ALKPO|nr:MULTISPECIES: YrzI family small protein [Alkalihalophilus]ADC50373.1 hypothetical protein BpOF4_11600 [Alkalihalophilus pseudofirmus OF4]MED1600652.1 YrzI family small protein [Alkalihalophilus marmarensis]
MTFSILFLTVTIQNKKLDGKQLEKVVRQQHHEEKHEQLINKLYM